MSAVLSDVVSAVQSAVVSAAVLSAVSTLRHRCLTDDDLSPGPGLVGDAVVALLPVHQPDETAEQGRTHAAHREVIPCTAGSEVRYRSPEVTHRSAAEQGRTHAAHREVVPCTDSGVRGQVQVTRGHTQVPAECTGQDRPAQG